MKTTVKLVIAETLIALLLLVGNTNIEASEKAVSSYDNTEAELQLEGWMTNESIWDTDVINMYEYNIESDSTLEVEDWMTSSDNWINNANILEESEMSLELERWMTDDFVWDMEDQDVESELKVENWMMDDKIWK